MFRHASFSNLAIRFGLEQIIPAKHPNSFKRNPWDAMDLDLDVELDLDLGRDLDSALDEFVKLDLAGRMGRLSLA